MSSPVTLSGPFDESGTPQGPLTELYNLDQSQFDVSVQTNSKNVQGTDGEGSLLAALQGSREVRFPGSFTYLDRYRPDLDSGPDSTPKDAFRRWLFEIESLVLPYQGVGYKLDDSVRGFVKDPTTDEQGVLIEEISWTYSKEDFFTTEYDISAVLTRGAQPATQSNTDYDNRSQFIDQQFGRGFSGKDALIRTDNESVQFDGVESRTLSRSVDVKNEELLAQTGGQNQAVGLIQSGVNITFQIEGSFARDPSELDRIASFFDTSSRGAEVTVSDAVTGREFSGVLSSVTTTFEAGQERRLTVSTELEVGTQPLSN